MSSVLTKDGKVLVSGDGAALTLDTYTAAMNAVTGVQNTSFADALGKAEEKTESVANAIGISETATLETIEGAVDDLIDDANETTGGSDTNLTDAVGTLIDGYGQGSDPVIQSLSVTANGTYAAPAGVDGYSPVAVNVGGGRFPTGISDIYYGEYTPPDDLDIFEVTHGKNSSNVLLVAVWAETLGDITPEISATVAKFWAKTTVQTQRGGNGFSPGYAWNVTNSYASPTSPNIVNYETLLIDNDKITLPRASSSVNNYYLAGVTYKIVIVFGEEQSNAGA